MGLRPGDLVVALDGKPMENGRQFHVCLYRRLIGNIVMLEVLRNGQILKVPIAMSEREDPLAGLGLDAVFNGLADTSATDVYRLIALGTPGTGRHTRRTDARSVAAAMSRVTRASA